MLGSLGNINSHLVPKLIQAHHQVTVITSNPDRVSTIEKLGAKARVGSMLDEAFLTDSFTGADLVYLMISTKGPTTDLNKDAKEQGTIFKNAIKAAHVSNVVDLSSIGANIGPEAGSLYAYSFIEEQLNQLPKVNVAFIRPVAFYSNLFANLPSIKATHSITALTSENTMRRYVAPSDIADLAYQLITNIPLGHTINYVMSDEFSYADLISHLKIALNIPDLKQVTINSEEYKNQLTDSGLPQNIVNGFVQMTVYSGHPEKIYADMANHPVYVGKVKLADFINQFKEAYNHPSDQHRSNTIVNSQ